jgi:hypothetical protein
MICSYCQTENENSLIDCEFCGAPLDVQRPKTSDFVYLEQCELPFQELCMFHTYDLLILLRLVREEITKCYHLMRSVQKGSRLIEIDSETFT